jgi:hypothetical protein
MHKHTMHVTSSLEEHGIEVSLQIQDGLNVAIGSLKHLFSTCMTFRNREAKYLCTLCT